MARLSPRKAGLALFVILALQNTLAEEKCRTGCNGVTPNNFKYAEGTTYKYSLESTVDILLSTAEGQQTSTKLKANVLLTQQPNCNQLLRLQNVQILGADGKKHGTIPDLDKAIRLNFHDGHLEDVICVEHGDNQNSLNIKRAVASLFQAALNHNHETDIFGVCPTDTTTEKEGATLIIKKSKNLNRCSHRENVKHDFMATAFNIHSEIKSSPILKSTLHSEQKIKDGILDNVIVTEDYLYVPFSVGNNGAKAIVQTKLHFTGKSKETPKQKCTEARSILFENPHPTIAPKCDVNTILQATKDVSNSIGTTVGDKTAGKFGSLIKILAAAKKDDLLSAYSQVRAGAGFNDKVTAKKVFLDALFRTGTGESIEVAIELLKSKQLSTLEQKFVYLGMSFVRHATPQSISSAATLLDLPDVPREAYLGIGTIASRYCKTHKCDNLPELNQLTQKLLAKLKDGKPSSKKTENEIIAILKSLGNMKHLSDTVIPKLTAIAQDKKNPTRLRIVALETYTTDPCKDKLRDSAIGILKDIQQDSEVRIKAYLALAQCPNGKVANVIKTVLDNEPSYQVGGFIVSHIRNLRASTNPDKELAKQELQNVNTVKRFPIDPRKYSFNSELSYTFDSLGMSSSTEGNIIYSQNSFLPRSTSLNLTTEIFGHKVNFLEIDMRQENLDKLLEHYVGPLGVLRSKSPEDLLNSGKESVEKVFDLLKERIGRLRSKRQVPRSEIDAIGKQITIKTNELNNDLDLDSSFKIFGSEFLFLSLNQDITKYTPEVIIDNLFDKIDDGFAKLKAFDHTFNNHHLFLDAELSYPTSIGFPLKLGLEGVATTQLKTSGAIDLKSIFGGKDHLAKLTLIPSGNIEITGSLTLDSNLVESGLKVISNLHTSTGGAAELKIFNSNQGIDLKFSLPIEKQELINARHEIIFCNREIGHPDVHTPLKSLQSKDFSICLDHLNPIIGLTACVEINSPNPQLNQAALLPFPFNGNTKFGVTIERDAPMIYHYRDVYYTDAKKLGFETLLETLENHQKKVSLVIEAFAEPEKYVKAILDSPIKKATVEGRIIDDDREKSISAKFVHDQMEYSGKFGVAVSGTPDKAVYTPLIEYVTPGVQGAQKSPYTVEGTISADRQGEDIKYTFNDVKLVTPNTKPITIVGNIGKRDGGYFSDVQVSDGSNSGSVTGEAKITDNIIKLDAKVTNTLSPVANFHINYQLEQSLSTIKNSLAFAHGKDLNQKMTLHNEITRKYASPEDYHYSTNNKFSYPLIGVDAKFNLIKVPKSFEYDLEGKYNNIKVASKTALKYNQKAPGDYDFTSHFESLDNKVNAKATRDVTGDDSKIYNLLDVNGKKAEVSGTIKHHVEPNNLDVGCHLIFKAPQLPEPVTVDHGLTNVGENLKTHLKISRPSIVYIDFDLKAAKIDGANGHLKVNIENALKVDGEVKADKWIGKAHVIAEFPKIQRKIKTESTFKIADPIYNVAANFFPNFEKDTKKIAVVSNNNIQENAVTSHNTVDLFGNKFQTDVKGSIDGQPFNGKINGEVEITLPNEMYLAGKIQREQHTTDGVGKLNGLLSLEHRKNKNTPGRKAIVKLNAPHFDTKEFLYDFTYNVALDDSNGKNLNLDVVGKRVKEGDSKKADITWKMYGSVFKDALDAHLTCKRQEFSQTINYKINLGPKFTANVDVAYDFNSKEKPYTASFGLDMTTPNAKLRTVKLATNGKLFKKGDELEVGGSSKIFIDDDGSNPDATVDFSNEFDIKVSPNNGQIKSNIHLQKFDPIIIALGYAHSEENGVTKCQSDANIQYTKSKTIKADFSLFKPNPQEAKIELKLDTPFEHGKKIQINHHGKHDKEWKHFDTETTVAIDGKTHEIKNEMVFSSNSPKIKSEVKNPDGTVDKFIVSYNRVDPKHLTSELVLIVHKTGTEFEASFDGKINSFEDFVVVYKVNAPKLKLEKIIFEAKNQQNKASKTIEIQVTSNGQNIIKGSTDYKTREEGGKFIIEGSGEFSVKTEKKTGNFKFSRQKLTHEKHGEQGAEISLDASLGNKAIDAELKISNKQFRLLESYCEEKKQCAHFEIDSKVTTKDVTEFNHELEVNVDLRKLGLAHEFGLKVLSSRKGLQFDHTTDMHFQSQENNNYQFSLYIHPTEAGVSFTTPKRQVVGEGKFDFAKKNKGNVKAELSFYLDKKNEPTKKTALIITGDHTGDKNHGSIKTEAKFTTPGLSKDLTSTYSCTYDTPTHTHDFTLTLDIFTKPNNKIIITGKQKLNKNTDLGQYSSEEHYNIKSAGMAIDITLDQVKYNYDSKTHSFKTSTKLQYHVDTMKHTCLYLIEISPKRIHNKLQIFDREIYDIESKLQLSKEEQIIDTDARIIGATPTTSHFSLKNFNTLQYTLSPKGKSDKLIVNSGFIPGQIADFRAEINKKELIRASVKLDEANFLKPDYGMSTDAIQELLIQPIQKQIGNVLKEGRNVVTDVANDASANVKHLSEVAKKNIPNLKPIREYYEGEFGKLKDEIGNDKTIKEIANYWHEIFGTTLKIFNEFLQKFLEFNEKLMGILQANFEKFAELFDKDIAPQIKDLLKRLLDVANTFVQRVSDIFFTVVAKITEIIDAHQAEFKQIATTLSTIAQDVGRFLHMNYDRLRELISSNVKHLYEEIKALPIYEEFKARYQLIMADISSFSEPLTNVIKDALITLRDVVPNEDIKKIISAVSDYLDKKLRKEPVDDLAAIESIFRNLLVAIKKVLKQFKVDEFKFVDPNKFLSNYLYALPRLVAAKFSPLNHLLRGRDGAAEVIKETLYGVSFNPRSWIPPGRLYGFIVQGQHIFTFDGKHITFPGTCNYLLSRDAVNGNFTIAGTYTKGILTAITLADKTDSVTLKKGGQLLLNKDATDFPARKPNLEAFRTYEAMNAYSKAGVGIECDSQLETCAIIVSGFYHGQLRGLLGNGNQEPYDDFTMANGKIVTSESDFANSYKMAASCPNVKCLDHSTHNHAPSCTELFGPTSSLRLCYPFVNTHNFRVACDHGVATGVKDTERAVAKGYVSACNAKYIPVELPEKFLRCKNGDEEREIGDTFSVSVPAKAADIVIVIDQVKHNELIYKEMVQPLANELLKDFGAKGVNDVEFHVVGYGGEYQHYPSHFTNGGKFVFKGKLPNVKFTNEPKEKSFDTGCQNVNKFLEVARSLKHDIDLVTGQDIQSRAFTEVIEYPFRAHAAKIIIAFTGKPCDQGKFLLLQIIRSALYDDESVQIHTVTPGRDFKVKDSKVTKSVIGFEEERVFTFDSKKKSGDSELFKDLEYDDYCIDYTLANGGMVFITDNFTGSKGKSAKTQYVQVMSNKIVDKAMSTKLEMDCECDYDSSMRALNRCEVVNKKEVEHKH